MIMVPVVSSNVAAIGHDPETNALKVTFKSGVAWLYQGITAAAHADLMAADSIGSWLRKHVIPSALTATKVSA